MSFNWCFIGTGKIANRVAKQVMTLAGHKIVSVYNRTKEKALSFAKKYGSKVYDSPLEAIKDPQVDGVYIATSNDTHFSFAKLCLENKIPVLCEKPITGNAKEFEKIIDIQKENDTFLCEAMWTWFNPVSLKVKEWINEGRIGKILSVDCRFTAPMLGYHNKNSRLARLDKYGGVLLDLGVYTVRYVYELFGKPKTIVSKGKLNDGVDIYNDSIFGYKGFDARVLSRMNYFQGEYCLIKGDKGTIKVPFFHMANKAILKTKGHKEVFKDKRPKFAYEFETVAKDIKEGKKESNISIKSSLEVMKLMDEIRKQIDVVFPCDW